MEQCALTRRPVSRDGARKVARGRPLGRDAFALLESAGVLAPELAARMKRMVGFRNVAIHEYRQIDLGIVRSIVHERLDDFLDFTSTLLRG